MNSPKKTGSARKIRLISIAAGSLCGLGLLNSAIALPPLSRGSSSPDINASARSRLAGGQSLVHQAHTSTALLDLRPPKESASPAMHDATGAVAPVAFPSAIHHGNLGSEDLGADGRMRPSAFGADEMSVQEMSQGQIIVERMQHIHREGLPIARLWESKSAVVSIGLNQRGKPGLWFTQRMH